MFIGYIINDFHPCLKTIQPNEIESCVGDKPILIVGAEQAYNLYPHMTLENKVIDSKKQIYYSFSKEESEVKYREHLTNFLSNCFQIFAKQYKIKPIVDLDSLRIPSKEVFLYETKTLLTITTNNKIYYLNKEIISFFNSGITINEFVSKFLKGKKIISWDSHNYFSAYTKANNCYQTKEQVRAYFIPFGDIDLYMGAIALDFLNTLDLTTPNILTWQRAYETQSFLSQVEIKVNEPLIKNLASDEENVILQNVYRAINNGYIIQHYNGTDKTTGRMYATSSGFSLQSLPKTSRDIIIAEEGCILVEFDYQYFEYAILSQLCKMPIKGDPHISISQLLFNDKEHRAIGKKVNYSLLYGESLDSLVDEVYREQTLAITKEQFKTKLIELVTPIKTFDKELTELFNKNGYINNYFNRNIIPKKGYACLNNYVQSTAADFVILKIEALNKYLKKYNLLNKIVLQNHDSILLNLRLEDIENTSLVDDINEILESPEENLVAKVDVKYGVSWGIIK